MHLISLSLIFLSVSAILISSEMWNWCNFCKKIIRCDKIIDFQVNLRDLWCTVCSRRERKTDNYSEFDKMCAIIYINVSLSYDIRNTSSIKITLQIEFAQLTICFTNSLSLSLSPPLSPLSLPPSLYLFIYLFAQLDYRSY